MRIKEVIKADEVGALEDVLPEFNIIQGHHKLTMQKLAELQDKKVWNSIYIRCFLCKEIKPIAEATLLMGHPTTESERQSEGKYKVQLSVKQVCEVVCKDCIKYFPKAPLFPEDVVSEFYSGKYDDLTIKEFREKMNE